MTCDVVIPAYNHPPTLPRALAAVKGQSVPPGWEVNVITSDQPHRPGPARNRALDQATGEIILFLGADIFLRPNALAHHLNFHTQHPDPKDAALGMCRWDPRLPPTPLMEWMVHSGQQNDFDSLLCQPIADPARFFYASNVSLKRQLIGDARFCDFGPYGWEDLDFGRRLTTRGLTLHVLHHAIGLHHHRYTVIDIATRQQQVGQGSPLIPTRSWVNHLRRRLFIALGGQFLLRQLLHYSAHKYSTPRLFLHFTATEFWRGVWKAQDRKKRLIE